MTVYQYFLYSKHLASCADARARARFGRVPPADAMHAPSARVATPGTVERTPRALGLGAAFVPLQAVAVADAIFEEIRASGTETRAPELTDRHLEVLASVFEEKHLSNALGLVQSGKVKGWWRRRRVVRASRSRPDREGEYLCYPDASCSCARSSGASSRRRRGVQHQLAVKGDRHQRVRRVGGHGPAHGAAGRTRAGAGGREEVEAA